MKGGNRLTLQGIGRTWGRNLQVVKGQRALLPTLMQILMIGATKLPTTSAIWTGQRC